MVAELAWFYVGGLTLLFFFWVYGIVSFARDVRNRLVPATRRYVAGSSARDEADESTPREEEERQQLY